MKLNKMAANFAILIATIIWASTFIAIKKSSVGVDAVALVCYRFALASVIMGMILLFLRKKPWQHLKEGLILGLLLFTSYVTQAIAIYYMMLVNAGFIAGLFVIFVPIISFFCGREKLRWNILVAIILAGIGLWSITGGIGSFQWGDLLMLFSSVMFAAHIVYADLVVKKCDIWVLNFQQFLVATLAGFFGILLFKLPFAVASLDVIWWILYLAIFANVLCYIIQLSVQKIISPTVFAIALSLEPIFIAIFAWTIGGEKIIIANIAGGLMIVVAIIFAQSFRKDEMVQVG
ncbi:MAG: hypothetical protein ACD_69C00320G0003 [uncultured bacterium]|nr:MAG: hypothetical protein ACD_69C00320G0003 [uncultured bacterium]HBS52197.1 hypothetical protein [Coxiellaceae bacterium]HBY56222.1 hypothetical protein [Coxiellaceae bacterium]